MKYRLLKDLPFAKAGEINKDRADSLIVFGTEPDHAFGGSEVEEMLKSGWLEEADEVWKPKDGEEYWLVRSYGNVDTAIWNNNNSDKATYTLGNCLKTREETEEVRYHQILKTKLIRAGLELGGRTKFRYDESNNCVLYNTDARTVFIIDNTSHIETSLPIWFDIESKADMFLSQNKEDLKKFFEFYVER